MTKRPKLIGTGVQAGLLSDDYRQEALKLRSQNRRLREVLGRLVLCEDAEFYPRAIERGSPYCIDFEEWYKDALAEMKASQND